MAETRVRSEFERQISASTGTMAKAYGKFLIYVVEGEEWKPGEKEDLLQKTREACDEILVRLADMLHLEAFENG